MPKIITTIVLFGLTSLLVACGDLPKPFAQSSVLNKNPLITLAGGGAIKVEVDPALPKSLSEPLSESMIKSLWKENVPASAAMGFSPRYLLRGELKILNSSLFEAEKVELIWTLSEVNKQKNNKFIYKLSGDRPGWLLLDKDPLNSLPGNIGKDVVRHLYKQQGMQDEMLNLTLNIEPTASRNQFKLPGKLKVTLPRISNDSPFLSKKPTIFLTEIVGAPGDGNNSLYKNMRRMLIIAGVNVVKERQTSMFLLNGFVNVSPTYDALNDIEITWLVTTKDGRIVGKATQNNRVSEDAVRREWGQVAKDAAREGSVGIMNIVARHLTSHGIEN